MEINTLSLVNLSGVDLVLLDLDNTLYEYKRCHEYALYKLAAEFSKQYNLTEEQAIQLYNIVRKKVHDQNLGTACSHSRLFYIQGMVEKLSKFTDSELISRLHDIYWDNYISYMTLYDDAVPFLNLCVENQVAIILVTDMLCETQFEKIKKLNIGKYFKFIVTSEEAGVEKPHPYIFELAITKALTAQLPVNKIAVIGDNIKKDIFTSSAYKVSTIHVLRNE